MDGQYGIEKQETAEHNFLNKIYLFSFFYHVLFNVKEPEPWFSTKMTSYQHRKSHCGDKTILGRSYLHNGIPYTDRMTSLYWIRVQVISNHGNDMVCPESSSLNIRKVIWWFTVTLLYFIAANWSIEATANTLIQAIQSHCADRCQFTPHRHLWWL